MIGISCAIRMFTRPTRSRKSSIDNRWMFGVLYQSYGNDDVIGARPYSSNCNRTRQCPKFGTTTIARYVDLDQPLDCAGSFRSEGLGIALFEAIASEDPTGLIGLPLIWVAGALRSAGLDPLAPAR